MRHNDNDSTILLFKVSRTAKQMNSIHQTLSVIYCNDLLVLYPLLSVSRAKHTSSPPSATRATDDAVILTTEAETQCSRID